ncbi:TolC family protein [Luminiphilus sp.]|nr:TolC family protein [Luminiphilus sp.]
MISRLILALSIGFSGTQASLASPEPSTAALSLETVYQLAVDQAPSLAIAQYRVDSAEAQSADARGSLLPQLSLFGEWSENKISYDGSLSALYGRQNYPGERYGFQARQALFNVAAFREMQRRRTLFDRSESDLSVAKMELIMVVTNAYLSVLIADDTVKQFAMESEALQKQLKEAEALYARALLPLTQVLETQTRSETVKADLIEAEGNAAIAREELTEIIGQRNFELMPIADSITLLARMASPEQAVAQALENSPAVSAAEEGRDAAELGVKREKGSWWPEVSLVVNQQYSDVGFDNQTSPARTTDSVSISVSYPLIRGGSGSARIRGAWADYYVAKEELIGTKRLVETQTRSALVRLDAAEKRVRAAQQALDTSEVTVTATQKSVKAGTARVTDVLLALAQRTRAQGDRLFANQQRIMAWLELELMMGNAPDTVAPVLSDALLSKAAVSATTLSQ